MNKITTKGSILFKIHYILIIFINNSKMEIYEDNKYFDILMKNIKKINLNIDISNIVSFIIEKDRDMKNIYKILAKYEDGEIIYLFHIQKQYQYKYKYNEIQNEFIKNDLKNNQNNQNNKNKLFEHIILSKRI